MANFNIQKYAAFIISGVLLLGLILTYFTYEPFHEFLQDTWQILRSEDKERVHEYFKNFGLWGPLAIIVFIILQMFLLVFPSWLPIIIAVLAYGFWGGILINLIGIGIASSLGYFIGDKLEDTFFNNFMSNKKFEKMQFWISNYAFGTVVLFRVSPFFSNDGISFIAGIFGMDFKKYLAATFTGVLPLSIAVAYFSEDFEKLEQGLYWIGGVGAVLYGFYIYIDYKKRKK